MWETYRQYPLALVVAIIGHIALVGALIYGFQFDADQIGEEGETEAVETIKAVAVNEELIQSEIDKLKKAEQKQRQLEKAAELKKKNELKALEEKRKTEEKRLKEIQLKREKEQQQALKEKEKRKKQEEQRKKAAAAEKKKKEAEQKAELKRQQEEEAASIERERVAALEAERKLEEERIAKIEAARQAEQAAKVSAQEERRLAGLKNEYITSVIQKVSNNWIQPEGISNAVECVVMAQQIPSGDVIDVNVLSCNGGGAAMPRSVELAVRKASPLPLPKDPSLFDRQLEFIFSQQ